jgi:hypothetical protein
VPSLSSTDLQIQRESIDRTDRSQSVHVRYTTDQDRIVAEVLEGEVMVVNLANGYYYVLEGTGADLWSLLAHGSTVAEATAAMTRRYAATPAEIETAVIDFVNQLVTEDLLDPAGDEVAAAAPDGSDTGDGLAPFTLPAMYKYTDMANLVQMDPIRDFEESRWPRRRATAKKPRS